VDVLNTGSVLQRVHVAVCAAVYIALCVVGLSTVMHLHICRTTYGQSYCVAACVIVLQRVLVCCSVCVGSVVAIQRVLYTLLYI